MLYGYWLSFQFHLTLEGNGANDMLRPGSLSSFLGATVTKRRAAEVALYCLVLPCIALYCLVLIREARLPHSCPNLGYDSYSSKTGACVTFERCTFSEAKKS